jgi:hypothetical protein
MYMNEKQLKVLFCGALQSGHIKNNDILPFPAAEMRIAEEANFRNFDLVVAAITQEPSVDYDNYNNMLVRTQLLENFARREKCRLDCLRFYPIELKSDDDTIDERLPSQIINAIMTFGLSILVLDKNHSKRITKSGLVKFMPATIICYTGVGDYFEVVSTFDRFISSGVFSFNRSTLARALAPDDTGGRALGRLAVLQRVLQKLAFNQIYYDNLGLMADEIEFLHALSQIRMPSNGRKRLASLIQETANAKMTDFL